MIIHDLIGFFQRLEFQISVAYVKVEKSAKMTQELGLPSKHCFVIVDAPLINEREKKITSTANISSMATPKDFLMPSRISSNTPSSTTLT